MNCCDARIATFGFNALVTETAPMFPTLPHLFLMLGSVLSVTARQQNMPLTGLNRYIPFGHYRSKPGDLYFVRTYFRYSATLTSTRKLGIRYFQPVKVSPSHEAILSATRNALAAMVRLGLTPPLLGINDESVINRLSTPCNLQSWLTTLDSGVLPAMQVPQGWP